MTPTYFRLTREGLGITWASELSIAIGWRAYNRFGFAYLSGRRGFGWSSSTGWVSWKRS